MTIEEETCRNVMIDDLYMVSGAIAFFSFESENGVERAAVFFSNKKVVTYIVLMLFFNYSIM